MAARSADGSLIGIQAVILNGASIGKNSLVAAGAVVTERKVFPDNSLIVGAPAKVLRELTEDDIAGPASQRRRIRRACRRRYQRSQLRATWAADGNSGVDESSAGQGRTGVWCRLLGAWLEQRQSRSSRLCARRRARGRDRSGRAAARETVESSSGTSPGMAIQADVTDTGSVTAAVEQAMQAFGRIDILHNNVGTTVMGGPVELTRMPGIDRWTSTWAASTARPRRCCRT